MFDKSSRSQVFTISTIAEVKKTPLNKPKAYKSLLTSKPSVKSLTLSAMFQQAGNLLYFKNPEPN